MQTQTIPDLSDQIIQSVNSIKAEVDGTKEGVKAVKIEEVENSKNLQNYFIFLKYSSAPVSS